MSFDSDELLRLLWSFGGEVGGDYVYAVPLRLALLGSSLPPQKIEVLFPSYEKRRNLAAYLDATDVPQVVRRCSDVYEFSVTVDGIPLPLLLYWNWHFPVRFVSPGLLVGSVPDRPVFPVYCPPASEEEREELTRKKELGYSPCRPPSLLESLYWRKRGISPGWLFLLFSLLLSSTLFLVLTDSSPGRRTVVASLLFLTVTSAYFLARMTADASRLPPKVGNQSKEPVPTE